MGDNGVAWKFNDYGADGTIMDWIGGVAGIPYSLCAEMYGDPNVDNSIDCFVQFNPENGEAFQETIQRVRKLYIGTFDYFLTAERRLAQGMAKSARRLQQRLVDMIEGNVSE